MKKQRYLLDTNICIFFMRGRYEIDKWIRSVEAKNCYISIITVAELYYGASCSSKPLEEKRRVKEFVTLMNVLPIDDVIQVYAENKFYLRSKGTLIDDFDLLIGSTSIVNSMTLVTDNIKHLGKIPRVKIENWVQR